MHAPSNVDVALGQGSVKKGNIHASCRIRRLGGIRWPSLYLGEVFFSQTIPTSKFELSAPFSLTYPGGLPSHPPVGTMLFSIPNESSFSLAASSNNEAYSAHEDPNTRVELGMLDQILQFNTGVYESPTAEFVFQNQGHEATLQQQPLLDELEFDTSLYDTSHMRPVPACLSTSAHRLRESMASDSSLNRERAEFEGWDEQCIHKDVTMSAKPLNVPDDINGSNNVNTTSETMTSTNVSDDDPVVGFLLQSGRFKCVDIRCARRSFGRRAELKRHYDGAHAPVRHIYWCPVPSCERSSSIGGKCFYRKDKLNDHIRAMHIGMASLVLTARDVSGA
ncbi:hypothetical protein FB567DRAFT_101770 [Paraphoma chrysanthemicola]|uniref:C2H2-type domain-containing protein n=1 Tax=Paraphoma chrysanthemicola TaxID=798071 RepID=A0A8K0R0S0_9PLEO|nr:hypothetical protein FB567DRAFT_101770 [Paraphoma chrysanthemicola]